MKKACCLCNASSAWARRDRCLASVRTGEDSAWIHRPTGTVGGYRDQCGPAGGIVLALDALSGACECCDFYSFWP